MNNEDEVCNKDGVDDDNSYHISSNCSAMHFSLPNTGALDKPCNLGQFGSLPKWWCPETMQQIMGFLLYLCDYGGSP